MLNGTALVCDDMLDESTDWLGWCWFVSLFYWRDRISPARDGKGMQMGVSQQYDGAMQGRAQNSNQYVEISMCAKTQVLTVPKRRPTMGAIPRSSDILHLSDNGLHLLLGQGRADHDAASTGS